MDLLQNLKRTAHLYLTNNVCETLTACVFSFNRFVRNPVGYDEENFRKAGVVWSEDNGVVAVGEERHQNTTVYVMRAEAGLQSVLPFDEVTQKVKRMDGLLLVFFKREPAEPMRKDLVSIDALGPKPHELPDGRDAVLCGVDVLLRP